MEYTYQTQGVCSRTMRISVEDGIITQLQVDGGCDGNLSGISRLVAGMPVEEVIARLEGVRCDDKPSSCPDQLARALKELL
ncbi:MAG: TIGR03905 family TSCPD domain-containing protein [Oscillospiraceae bacterium]|nr:TIGR03905 family TSCPD domain-containing protein [Oscillospiraceae bacterium]